MSKIKILVADDHQIVRQGLCALLGDHEGMEVIGEASDGGAAIQLAHDLAPDLVIMDISMPGVNGIEATRQIKTKAPAVR
ncbi:MAG: response regulator transcription factor, partial [Chloroflexota bacterium]